ncbi:MAG: D-aminoacylase [Acidobacteriota bacterium]
MFRIAASAIPVCAVLAATLSQTQPPASFDVLIRNGRVMDGSGNPWLRADVGIRGDRIVYVGRAPAAQAGTIIDAADRLVTPGFIDVHSHAAEGLVRPELRQGQPLLAQGVTTIVANPDGGGSVDLARQRGRLEHDGLGPNVALLIGHGSVRRAVMGEANRAPTAGELDRMRALVKEGMDQGAFGLSSGLFYTPGSYARTDEVVALAAVAAQYGGVYTSHIRDEGDYNIGVEAAVAEVIRVAEEAQLIGIVTHMKALGPDNWGRAGALTAMIDAARSRGVQVFADQYAYDASSTSLRAALLPGGVPVPVQGDAAMRAEVEPGVRENLRRRGGAASIAIAFYRPNPALEGKTLAEIAEARGVPAERAALDLMAAGNASIVSFNMAERDIEQIMRQPYTMTSSDGGLVLPSEGRPHPRDYGAFARKLSVYVRERKTIPLESAIRSMTSLPAAVFGLRDRGVIREGAIADIAIFDPAAVRDRATYTAPHQLAEGMTSVLVNGVVVIADGAFTAALPGKVLRR